MSTIEAPSPPGPRVPTGSAGLDEILGGGLAPNRLYLVEGAPGAGKTTLALGFLLAGAARGESGLYVTLSETDEELRSVAASHGWELPGLIGVFDLGAAEAALAGGPSRDQSVLHAWEIELGETVDLLTAEVERRNPALVVFDSLSELRLLAQDPLRYRRQILALKRFFSGRHCTVLLLDDLTAVAGQADLQLQSLCHGIVTLERRTLDYGPARRRLEVAKMRGSAYREGWHDYSVRTGGIEAFPRPAAAPVVVDVSMDATPGRLPSGVATLDALLGGGPLRGSSMLVTGPAGAGKTTIAMRYAVTAAARGERVAVFEFDERRDTLAIRCAAAGIELAPHVAAGRIALRRVNPAELSPGEFAHLVRMEVEKEGAGLLVIDSLNGYIAAMPEERQLLLQMHELLSYLNVKGATTLLLHVQHGLIGDVNSLVNISYLADTVMLLRYFEAGGRVRKAMSVAKNRGGWHEDTIRELRIGPPLGVEVGPPLSEFRGVLTGTPEYTGSAGALIGQLIGAGLGKGNAAGE
ncbi:ATPase domain-containing protein [Falsiroseomonas sp. HW251]|uniref:ATPase domain-containing protein n=1 Tax=Falsiroseomonas sp. HW251 TaxID=3390998 RepID=UPI003D31A0E9